MKKFFLLLLLCLIGDFSFGQNYPFKTIKEIQYNHPDSLLLLDSCKGNWYHQAANFLGDTVRVVGVCTVPPKTLTYTASGYNFVLADTGYAGPFGHIFLRAMVSTPGDSMYYQGMLNIQKGSIVEVVGIVNEFPAIATIGTSEIALLKNQNFNILGVGTLPPVYPKSVTDFLIGCSQICNVRFSTGEPFESGYVELTNLTVISVVNATNGTVRLVDDFGNCITTHDASKWWTLRGHRDPNSTYTSLFQINTRIDTLRGWIIQSTGSELLLGWRIAPVEISDVVIHSPTGIDNSFNTTNPEEYFLKNNYPNPFNPSTIIEYSIPREEFVVMKVFNVMGQEVATLKNEIQRAGNYKIQFDAAELSSGIYFYKLTAGNFHRVKKMLLLR